MGKKNTKKDMTGKKHSKKQIVDATIDDPQSEHDYLSIQESTLRFRRNFMDAAVEKAKAILRQEHPNTLYQDTDLLKWLFIIGDKQNLAERRKGTPKEESKFNRTFEARYFLLQRVFYLDFLESWEIDLAFMMGFYAGVINKQFECEGGIEHAVDLAQAQIKRMEHVNERKRAKRAERGQQAIDAIAQAKLIYPELSPKEVRIKAAEELNLTVSGLKKRLQAAKKNF